MKGPRLPLKLTTAHNERAIAIEEKPVSDESKPELKKWKTDCVMMRGMVEQLFSIVSGVSETEGVFHSQELLGPKFIEELSRQGPNRYTNSSSPPFVVYVFDKRANENLGKLGS